MKAGTYIAVSIASVVLVAALFLGGFFAGRLTRKPAVQTDTITNVVIVRDTLTQYKPEYITKTIIRKELVEVTDTIRINDTTYLPLPVERKVYADSNYRAVVTGIRPELEEISVYPKTKIVTQTITITEQSKPRRVTFSAQFGFGGQYDLIHREFGLGPYAGGGLSFNF